MEGKVKFGRNTGSNLRASAVDLAVTPTVSSISAAPLINALRWKRTSQWRIVHLEHYDSLMLRAVF